MLNEFSDKLLLGKPILDKSQYSLIRYKVCKEVDAWKTYNDKLVLAKNIFKENDYKSNELINISSLNEMCNVVYKSFNKHLTNNIINKKEKLKFNKPKY